VATFAGGFTYSTVITLRTDPSTIHVDKFDDISTLLSSAFILFSTSLFFTIMIQIVLRAIDPDTTIANDSKHHGVQFLFALSAVLLIVGFVLLDVVLIKSGEESVGIAGSILVGVVGIIGLGVGCCTKK
jgi:hypothetical protein